MHSLSMHCNEASGLNQFCPAVHWNGISWHQSQNAEYALTEMILKIKVQFTKTLVESKKNPQKVEKQTPNSAVLITNV